MIASVTHHIRGNEPFEAGETLIYFHPASGLEIIDVIINGVSQDYSAITVDENTGKIGTSQTLNRNDWVQVTYKTLPRVTSSVTMVDFVEGYFQTSDFT